MVVTHAQYDKNKTLLKILCNEELKECDVGTLSLEERIRIVLSEQIAVKIGTIISIQDSICLTAPCRRMKHELMRK